MSGYTPTTLQVEVAFLAAAGHSTHAGSRKEAFDRWLAAHDAEVRAGVVAEEPEWEYGIHFDTSPNGPVLLVASEARAMAEAAMGVMSGGVTAMRRTVRTGEWVPLKQEDQTKVEAAARRLFGATVDSITNHEIRRNDA
ncbi:hypothetical protein [Microbacterium sp. 2RAF4]|uniref:hypothetical protein n=1 Tax=Microbacterium sp. 2RAF4 TaxID=3232999 RepID=UPI003F9D0897